MIYDHTEGSAILLPLDNNNDSTFYVTEFDMANGWSKNAKKERDNKTPK